MSGRSPALQAGRQGAPRPPRATQRRPSRFCTANIPFLCSHPHHALFQRTTFTAHFFRSVLQTKSTTDKFLSTSVTDTSPEHTLFSSQHPPLELRSHTNASPTGAEERDAAPAPPDPLLSAAPGLLRAADGTLGALRPRPPLSQPTRPGTPRLKEKRDSTPRAKA